MNNNSSSRESKSTYQDAPLGSPFYRTPEAAWHARRKSNNSINQPAGDMERATFDAYYYAAQGRVSAPEQELANIEEAAALVQRIQHTSQLIEWMRGERLGRR